MSSFVDDYFTALFEWSPTTATATGFHEYDSRIEDLSGPATNARIGRLKELKAELERVRPRTRLIEKPYSLVLLVETLEEMLAESGSNFNAHH